MKKTHKTPRKTPKQKLIDKLILLYQEAIAASSSISTRKKFFEYLIEKDLDLGICKAATVWRAQVAPWLEKYTNDSAYIARTPRQEKNRAGMINSLKVRLMVLKTEKRLMALERQNRKLAAQVKKT